MANNIANTGFKNVIATASDAGIYITPLNKIATHAHPQADLVICSDKLGLLTFVFLKKTNTLTIIKAKKNLAYTIWKVRILLLAKVLPTFLLSTLPRPNKNAANKINKMGLLNRFIICFSICFSYFFVKAYALLPLRAKNNPPTHIKTCRLS